MYVKVVACLSSALQQLPELVHSDLFIYASFKAFRNRCLGPQASLWFGFGSELRLRVWSLHGLTALYMTGGAGKQVSKWDFLLSKLIDFPIRDYLVTVTSQTMSGSTETVCVHLESQMPWTLNISLLMEGDHTILLMEEVVVHPFFRCVPFQVRLSLHSRL